MIIDTAGRLAVDETMMTEISNIHKAVNPHETLFVVDSMTGQDAVNTAKAFNDVLNFEGVILTKLDGDTRGGAALSIKSVVNKPIKFIGTGEKMDAIDVLYPDRMADRILGWEMWFLLWKELKNSLMRKRQEKFKRKLQKTSLGLMIFFLRYSRSKKWEA